MLDTMTHEIVLKGIGTSPGICIGKAYLVDKEGVDIVKKYHIHEFHLHNEKNRFKNAVKKAEKELHSIIEDTPEDFRDHAKILETHIVLLKDKMLYGKTIEIIENEQINAEWALKKVVADLKIIFKNMSDAYFRERADDIVHVSDRILRNLVGAEQVNIKDIDKRVILVASDLSPAETSQIQLEKIMGFVTDGGGITSHTGIIARTIEIPAVLGLEKVTDLIKSDDFIIVDGTTGEVIIHPKDNTLVRFVKRKVKYEARRSATLRGSQLPAKTSDGFLIRIMGNIELPEEVVSVRDHGGEGIGLYRTEFQYLSRSEFPGEDELFDKYRDVVEIMSPKPVTIRTLDINGDKAIIGHSDTSEENPALGLRGIRYCLKKKDVFKTQLRAILRAAAFGNVKILFPMISDFNELFETKEVLDEVAESLEKEGVKFNRDIEIGIMIEVPSAVVLADVLAKEADFFSIGTNDLIQYALAIDRGNRDVAHLYQPLHPAIIRMVKYISDVAKDNGINVSICGEMAAQPFNIPVLLGLGMDELSMNPQSMPAVKKVIRSLKMADIPPFMNEIFSKTTVKGVLDLVKATYGSILSDKI